MAFESQRAKEQMAIDRGLQYQRAIQLFYRKYRVYPQTLDDLETTRNIRFLRRRYLDPLTGKDWRLLHVGPSGQLTDSLVQPPAPLPGSSTGSGLNSAQGSSQTGGFSQTSSAAQAPTQGSNSGQPVDPNNPNGQAPDPLNMAQRRPSDRIIGHPGARTPVSDPGGEAGGEPVAEQPAQPEPEPEQPQQPGQQPPAAGATAPGEPAQPPADPNAPQDPSQPQTPGQQPVPGQPIPGQQPVPGEPAAPQGPPQAPIQFPPVFPGVNAGQTPNPSPNQFPNQPPNQFGNQAANPGQSPSPFQQNPGFQQGNLGQQVPGQAGVQGPGNQPQSAANLIQQILTTPRQPPSSIAGFTSGNTGGIAGVASTADGKGIHVVNDHAKYKEWEFVYDLKKDKTVVGAAGVNQQQQVQQQMQQNQNGAFGNSSSPFSSSPTISAATPTGSTSPATPAAPTTAPPTQ